MEQEKLVRIQETLKDEEFAKQIAAMQTEEQIQKAFAAKNIEISAEELEDLKQKGAAALSNNELEEITGGGAKHFAAGFTAGFVAPVTGALFAIDRRDCVGGIESGLGLTAGSLVLMGVTVGATLGIKKLVDKKKKAKK